MATEVRGIRKDKKNPSLQRGCIYLIIFSQDIY
jgi:hypothetical protein